MQIIKPRTLSLISQTYHYRRTRLAVGVLGFFRFGEEHYLSEQEGWKTLEPLLQQGLILDTGHAKACGEFLLIGDACAPEGQTISHGSVSVRVGDTTKSLQVVGDRYWHGRRLRRPTPPKPFTRIPLSFERAYGGQDFADNPLGKGRVKNAQGLIELPNLYAENDSTKPSHHTLTPTTLGPIDVRWPQRQRYIGTYDQQWLDSIHPGFADDTDPAFFNAAMTDQHLKEFITPGCEVELKGCHAEKTKWQFCVPEYSARVFIEQTTDDDSQFLEAPSRIDTLWLFPELGMGLVIHRAEFAVNDSLGLDVKRLLLAYERTTDTPRPASHYQQQLHLRSDPVQAATQMVYEAPLKPLKTQAEQQHIDSAYANARQQLQQKKETFIAELRRSNPTLPATTPPPEASNEEMPTAIPAELIQQGEVDLTPLQQQAQTHIQAAKQQAEDAKKAAEKAKKAPQQRPKMTAEFEQTLQRRVFAQPFKDVSDSSSKNSPSKDSPNKNSPNENSQLSPLAQAAKLQQQSEYQARQSSPVAMIDNNAMPAKSAGLIRQWVQQLLASGESLAGRDLSGADLSGLDFSDCDLTRTALENCDLRDCQLQRANLHGAILTGSQLQGACFSNANLQQANLSACHGEHVVFTHAKMQDTLLMDAQLEAADFSYAHLIKLQALNARLPHSRFEHAQLQQGQLIMADLTNSRWQHATLQLCNFSRSSLSHSCWQHCSLFRCIMVDLDAPAMRFNGCKAEKVQFSNQGNLSHAQFEHCHWHTCGFRDLDLSASQIEHCVFEQCDLASTNLQKSCFKHCLWANSVLLLTDFSYANLEQCLFNQGRLNKSQFCHGKLTDVTFVSCSTTEMNTDHAELEQTQVTPQASVQSSSA
ncbi:hypothetical protein CHH28_14645 [Bacterioplanes sanyensis]|uniref:DUF2169 domain-containing protein n=1 Tax=Bacterioplanes sanyensis TaxID=1249553 RepID=A0A222FLD2_9GAMM|nr:DUF2169 domain-containing protein [Bacterioplanes sanyensis]ASP39835.1 hypothetical protein CHH28_14645 [Bacterioplanes sanyensis]